MPNDILDSYSDEELDIGSVSQPSNDVLNYYNLDDKEPESVMELYGKAAKGVGLGLIDIPRKVTEHLAGAFFEGMAAAGQIPQEKVDSFKSALEGQRQERLKGTYGGDTTSDIGAFITEQTLIGKGAGLLGRAIAPAAAKAMPYLAANVAKEGIGGAGAASLAGDSPLVGGVLGAAGAATPYLSPLFKATPEAEAMRAAGVPISLGQAIGSKTLSSIENPGIFAKQNKTLAEKFETKKAAANIEETIFQGNQKAYDDIVKISDEIEAKSSQNYNEIAYQIDQIGPASIDNTLKTTNQVKEILSSSTSLTKPNPAVERIANVIQANPTTDASTILAWKKQVGEVQKSLKKDTTSGALDSDFQLLNDINRALDADLKIAADKVGLTKEIDEANQFFANSVVTNRSFREKFASERRDVGEYIDKLYSSKGSAVYDDLKSFIPNMSAEGKEALSYGLLARSSRDFIDDTGVLDVNKAMKFMKNKADSIGLTTPKDARDALEGLNNIMKGLQTEAIRLGQGKTHLPGVDPTNLSPRVVAQIAARGLFLDKTIPMFVQFKNYNPKDPRMQAVIKHILLRSFQGTAKGAAVQTGVDMFSPRDLQDR